MRKTLFLIGIILPLFISAQRMMNCSQTGVLPYGPCYAADVSGDYAYIGNGRVFQVIDISNLNFPALTGELITESSIHDIVVSGDYAYVANRIGGLRIIDIRNPAEPVETGFLDFGVDVFELFLGNQYIYMADHANGMYIADVHNPAAPMLAGLIHSDDYTNDVFVDDNIAYIVYKNEGLKIYNVQQPASPISVGSLKVKNQAFLSIQVKDGLAYIAGFDSLHILDVSVPSAPVQAGAVSVNIMSEEIVVRGDYAYVSGTSGLAVLDIRDPSSPGHTGFFATGVWCYDVVLKENFAFLACACMGLRFVYVGTPSLLTEVGHYSAQGVAVDLVVRGQYAYCADIAGFRILDLNTPSSPREAAFVNTKVAAFDVDVQGLYAYVAGGKAGFRIYNISKPDSPVEAGFWNQDSYITSVDVSGGYAYVSDGLEGLRIFDIRDPASPLEIAEYNPGLVINDLQYADGYGYLAVACETSGLHIFDMQNPALPEEIGVLDNGNRTYGVYCAAGYVYLAEDAGLRIVNVSDPSAPLEISFYHTSERIDRVRFDYPYAYITAGEQGLRILDVRNPQSVIEVGYYMTGNRAMGLFIRDHTVYFSENNTGFYILQNDLLDGVFRNHVLSLDGDGDYLSLPELPQLFSGFTVSFRLAPSETWDASRSGNQILYEAEGSQAYVCVQLNEDGRLSFQTSVGGSDACYSTADSWAGNQWIHVAAMYSSETRRAELFINGILNDIREGVENRRLKTQHWHRLGAAGPDNSRCFDGRLDDVGIWNRACTVSEIQSAMNSDLTGMEPGLFCLWTFDSGTPRDETVNGHHGTLMGDAVIVPADNFSGMAFRETASCTPLNFRLYPNRPNPFNPATEIRYDLPRTSHVETAVFNIRSQRIKTLENVLQSAGSHSVRWDGTDDSGRTVAGGIYVCRIRAGEQQQAIKMIMVR
ncbi:hypothetical protein JW948_15015 [bacterium]|nr:hypothetical protein [bacterium]